MPATCGDGKLSTLQLRQGELLGLTEFAVVAKVESLSRIRLAVEGKTEGNAPEDFPELEIVASPDTFLARGTCVDVLKKANKQEMGK